MACQNWSATCQKPCVCMHLRSFCLCPLFAYTHVLNLLSSQNRHSWQIKLVCRAHFHLPKVIPQTSNYCLVLLGLLLSIQNIFVFYTNVATCVDEFVHLPIHTACQSLYIVTLQVIMNVKASRCCCFHAGIHFTSPVYYIATAISEV